MIRLHYYDNAKFFLIISVILGHLLQNNGMLDRVSVGIFDTIFMYAMPAFVFISGVFSPPKSYYNIREKLTNVKFFLSELGLVETMIIFSLIMKLPVLIESGMSLYEILLPGYTLWYLLALVWWRLFVYLLPQNFIKHKHILIIFSVLISLFSGYSIRGELIALPRTLFFLPYFVVGFCVSDKREQIVSTLKRIPIIVALLIIVCVLILNICVGYNQLPFNTGNVPYYKWEMGIFDALLWRLIFTVLCIIVSVSVLRIIPSKQTFISEFGAKTIVLYVYHAIILFFVNILFEQYGLPVSIFFAFMEFIVIVPVLMLISKSKIANALISPISKLINKIKYEK